jgi:radical SAM superfamily enzyme YgiQ (UPF0313 family)
MIETVRVLLLSTYDLGRQPFGLASPAAWLRGAGHEVTAIDLARDPLRVGNADVAALYLSMHTAMRLSLKVIEKIRAESPAVRICCYGLYAPLNEELLRAAGVEAIFGGEFEKSLVDWVGGGAKTGMTRVSMERLRFVTPDRTGLPVLERYAQVMGAGKARTVGYTEASRGCKHLCRHCPIVPVYNGAFRVVQRDVVLEDIRRQVAAGARHITFGDPDFFNGVGHALKIVQEFHAEFPGVSYDVTIKVEHLLKHRASLETLRRTGCLFVTSAVESVDDGILTKFAKGHTRADFYEAVSMMRAAGLPLSPTFVTFTPWTTREGYCDLLRCLVELDLVESVAPIQLAIRLLLPAGSRLLDLPEVRAIAGPFDAEALAHRWRNPDVAMDELCLELQKTIAREEKRGQSRTEIFRQVWEMANGRPLEVPLMGRATVPYLNEPWYC